MGAAVFVLELAVQPGRYRVPGLRNPVQLQELVTVNSMRVLQSSAFAVTRGFVVPAPADDS
jgi:hypothetical protein